jgi:superfamily II DNA or RNA helicase
MNLSMLLASRLAFHFRQNSVILGRELSFRGAVRLVHGDARHVEATVFGGRAYDVQLCLNDSDLIVSCTCPFFQDVGPCKHLFAVVLEADRQTLLTDALAVKGLNLLELNQDDEAYDAPAYLPPPPPVPRWQDDLRAIQTAISQKRAAIARLPRDFEVLYVIDLMASKTSQGLTLGLFSRSRKKNGDWSAPKEFRLAPSDISALPDPLDADTVAALFGSHEYLYSSATPFVSRRRLLSPALAARLIPPLAKAGRLLLDDGRAGSDRQPAAWDESGAWEFRLEVLRGDHDQWSISGSLRRGEERMGLDDPLLITDGGLVFTPGRVAPLRDHGAFAWISQLRRLKRIKFPDHQRDNVLGMLLAGPVVPPLELDDDLKFEERRVTPRLGLRISQTPEFSGRHFEAHFLVDYGQGWIESDTGERGLWLPEERVLLLRDAEAEAGAQNTLAGLGLKQESGRAVWRVAARSMPAAVRELLHAGWHVDAEGKAFRRPGAARMEVCSGIDWFELHGEVDYDGTPVPLPQLLAALRRGDNLVPLGDGAFGLLPEEWLERFAPIACLGSKEADHLRFERSQAGLLDALLAAQPEVRVDEIFERTRARLRAFASLQPAPQPAGFTGCLREYQKEGLGWMAFLRDYEFGGCLADDMGVGKTAQVLAALELRRAEGAGPSLVVAPKSLMFNWRAEAERFTPQLKVLEHTGMARDAALIGQHDLVLTTYGTLLRDVPQLAGVEFDYVVLDEAQAIKNASTSTAKAVRLLRGRHRLALSGTPVENHLGELWSLFEFLNPGMLGESRVLKLGGGQARNPGPEARSLLAQALRPFILRRTKQQVARELPEKTEQTIFCDLDRAQRSQYDELLRHYRGSLLQRVERDGLGRSKMHVLEALLRLRQAACHPGLIDPKRAHEPSAKIDVLLDQLQELQEEGHKALVFSQFTSLLAIVRTRLDQAGIRYEYLDGATRDRQDHVAAFQDDEDCRLFLISLKAGGLGLNLTAAEYVFLLDPWWNPAVEAQAIDRAHRIGQTRPVFAYRLIARETVEEKVLELQKTKRDLADAILGEDHSLIRDLKREDLELLLS